MTDLNGLGGRDIEPEEVYSMGVVINVEFGNCDSQFQRQEYRTSRVESTLWINTNVNSSLRGSLGCHKAASLWSCSMPGMSHIMSCSKSVGVFEPRPRSAHGMVFQAGSSRKHRFRSIIYPIAYGLFSTLTD